MDAFFPGASLNADPNEVCRLTAEKCGAFLTGLPDGQGYPNWWRGVTTFDYAPLDPLIVFDKLPALMVDFNISPYSRTVDTIEYDQRQAVRDHYTLQLLYPVTAGDVTTREAVRAMRWGWWMLRNYLVSAYSPINSFGRGATLLGGRVMTFPADATEYSGIMPLYGYLVFSLLQL